MQSNCERRKHDFQIASAHRDNMFDDPEALQGAVVQNEDLRGH